jgi:hypothetical protein
MSAGQAILRKNPASNCIMQQVDIHIAAAAWLLKFNPACTIPPSSGAALPRNAHTVPPTNEDKLDRHGIPNTLSTTG